MKVEPLQHGKENWILGRNPKLVTDARVITGELDGTGVPRLIYDGFWTGDAWSNAKGQAKAFNSEASAITYRDANVALFEA